MDAWLFAEAGFVVATSAELHLRAAVGKNVRHRREEIGWSLETAADIAGIDARTWQKIERSEQNATMRLLSNIAVALNVDPLDLFARSPQPKPRRVGGAQPAPPQTPRSASKRGR